MGRHQVNPTRKYYIFDSASNKSICQIVGCEARIAGNHGGNLQRHIEKKHPNTYKELQRQLGTKRPAGDGGHTALRSVVRPEDLYHLGVLAVGTCVWTVRRQHTQCNQLMNLVPLGCLNPSYEPCRKLALHGLHSALSLLKRFPSQ